MKILDLGRFRRAHVWVGDLPNATYEPKSMISHTLAAGGRSGVAKRLAAVELFVPLGARSMYGLIGGEFHPGEGGLMIQVNVSSHSERHLTDSLASNVDDVRVGLPDEYVSAVFSGINAARSELGEIASGNLFINHAAHGVMCSSPAIYESLAIVLMKIFNIASLDISDSELIGLFPGWLR